MATVPPTLESDTLPPTSVGDRFRRLAAHWNAQTAFLSSMDAAARHPAYQEIIRLGPPVVPLLLRDMEETHQHWFLALSAITGVNPVSLTDAGNIPRMVRAWLEWAKDQGYQW